MQKKFTKLHLKQCWVLILILLVGVYSSTAQSRTVTGKVTTLEEGDGLPMANVVIKGTTNGTITDIDGNFRLDLNDDQNVLVFSFIGYESKEVDVAGRSVVDVVMNLDVETLEDVVVVGYSNQSKKLITGNISSIGHEELNRTSPNNFQNSIQGLAPGVDVTGGSGALGGSSFIRIRGVGSISSNSDPLYVIDGMPVSAYPSDVLGNFGTTNNPLSTLDPNDIENIQVLKDAQAGAIYGSRAANGVIIITTKSGKTQKTQYNVSYSYGISRATNMVDMIDGPSYINLLEETWENGNVPAAQRIFPRLDPSKGYTEEVARNINIDKYDLAYRTGVVHDASISATGGSEKLKFYIQGSFRDEEGILERNEITRASARANIDYIANDKFSFGVKVNGSVTSIGQFPTNYYFLSPAPGNGGVFQYWSNPVGLQFIRFGLPFYPSTFSDGSFFQPQYLVNVAPTLNQDYFEDQMKNVRLLNTVYFNYQITPNLSFKSQMGMNYFGQWGNTWVSPLMTTISIVGDCKDCYGYADAESLNRMNLNAFTTLNYHKDFNEHSLDALVGFEYNDQTDTRFMTKGVGFPPTNSQNSVTSAKEPIYWMNSESGAAFYSGFFQGTYGYKQKYLAGLSIRTDGSSRFGPKNRWGTFAGGSLGWIMSNEDFMDESIFNFFKIRGSYGVNGNAEIDQSAAFANWKFYPISYAGAQGISPLRLQESTDNISWEEAYILDLGVSYEMFQGRVKGEVTVYHKKNTALLAKLDLPPSSGVGNFILNAGTMVNKGLEIGLNTVNLDGEFKWSSSFNIGFNRNKVIELAIEQEQFAQRGGLGQPVIGESIASFFMVKWLGVDPQTGYEMFEDPETGEAYQFDDPEKPRKDEMANLRQHIKGKTGLPDYTGSLNNSFNYKGLEFNFTFYFKQGNYVYEDEMTQLAYLKKGNQANNYPQFMYDARWQQPGDVTTVPKVTYDHPLGYNDPLESRSTRFLYDASYIRLRNITLAYNLPKDWSSRMKLRNMRIYVSADNLLTFTGYNGWDPEAYNSLGSFSPTEANVLPGYAKGNPPQAKSVRVGVNLNF